MATIDKVTTVRDMMDRAAQWSDSVALVPTMGYLHEGHLDLVREAAKRAKIVVVSIFVNPLQFGPGEDFSVYPRDIDRDIELLEKAGATLVFSPDYQDFTPDDIRISVEPGRMGDVLCGQYRPGHFTGVCTIVLKLFQVIWPDVAVFGWKDAQQFLIIQRMVSDLNVPLQLVGVATRREESGLAMSSRNSYLTIEQKEAASAIYRSLVKIARLVKEGETRTDALLENVRMDIEREPLLKLQYAEAVSMDKLERIENVEPGNTLIALAVFAGKTRLIDNVRL